MMLNMNYKFRSFVDSGGSNQSEFKIKVKLSNTYLFNAPLTSYWLSTNAKLGQWKDGIPLKSRSIVADIGTHRLQQKSL